MSTNISDLKFDKNDKEEINNKDIEMISNIFGIKEEQREYLKKNYKSYYQLFKPTFIAMILFAILSLNFIDKLFLKIHKDNYIYSVVSKILVFGVLFFIISYNY